MGIEAEVSRKIFADSDAIWELLSDLEAWPTWWVDCVIARTMDSRTLREGSTLEVLVKPRAVSLTLNPVVDLFTERKLLSLTHRSAFIHSTATWQLVEKNDAVTVTASIVFNGLLPFLITIAQQSSVVRFSLNNNLKGLKKAAEKRY
jgi:hypothetical protein